MGLREFQMRLAKHAHVDVGLLRKSLHPDDFTGIINETTPEGHAVVDHLPDLSAHPPSHDARVQHYNQAIADQSPLVRKTPISLTGITAKAVLSLPRADSIPAADRYIIKPYHEVINPKATFWQHHPIQGWAEMSNQALWHAAGMGAMHQKVHVSEHHMGPGREKEPAIVIKMENGADFANHLTPSHYSLAMHDELPKIAAMDFLSNNLDRHQANLMFLPAGARDDKGQLVRNRILAIDHGRSFQYHASNKGAPKVVHDPFLGTLPVDEETRKDYEREGKASDNLVNYIAAKGIREFDNWGTMYGKRSIVGPHHLFPVIARWWPGVRDNVVQAMNQRLGGLREPQMREHILKNFNERVGLLDKIAANPEWWMRESKVRHLEVPLHVWNR
jgi:hypothetical protein